MLNGQPKMAGLPVQFLLLPIKAYFRAKNGPNFKDPMPVSIVPEHAELTTLLGPPGSVQTGKDGGITSLVQIGEALGWNALLVTKMNVNCFTRHFS